MKETGALITLVNNSKVKANSVKSKLTIKQADTPQVYTAITSDDYKLEDGIIYVLIDSSDKAEAVIGDGENTWSGSIKIAGGEAATVSWNDITDKPVNVTTTVDGFMSAADKVKLNGVATGATANSPATVAPLANGTAAVGTSTLYARQDHVHPLQASVATLTTGRTFSLSGGATGTSPAFNGSANATIPVTLAAPTLTVRGGVLQQAAIADVAAAPTQAEFNSVLAALRAAGLLAV